MATQNPSTYISLSADPALAVFASQLPVIPSTAQVVVIELYETVKNTTVFTTEVVNNITNNPGGSSTQVQYNTGSAFGGDTGLTFNSSTKALTVTGNVNAGNVVATAFTGLASVATYATTANAVAGANVSGFVANANVANTAWSVAGANVSGYVANANVANTALSVGLSGVSGLGNIAVVNLDGNVANLITGTGTFVAIPVAGLSGFSGLTGLQGLSGFSGLDGTQGLSGFSGLTGLQGLSGFSGLDGTQGLSGFSGLDGTQGLSGFSGLDGTGIVAATIWISLPAPTGNIGMRSMVTDSGLTAVGSFGLSGYSGGANIVPVYSDGTQWLIG